MRLKPIFLAVEDDEEFRRGLESVLSRFGVNIVAVKEAQVFLDEAEKLKPDLYLIDLNLDASNGMDLIHELRVNRKVNEPILVLTGSHRPELISHALELGANDYVTKPLDRTFLASKLSLYVKTTQIEENKALFYDILPSRTSAVLHLNAQTLEVDELGVKLASSALIPKGTVFKLRCEALRSAGVRDGEVLVAVSSTELDTVSKKYISYAEFDGVDVEFMQNIRRWLSEKSG